MIKLAKTLASEGRRRKRGRDRGEGRTEGKEKEGWRKEKKLFPSLNLTSFVDNATKCLATA